MCQFYLFIYWRVFSGTPQGEKPLKQADCFVCQSYFNLGAAPPLRHTVQQVPLTAPPARHIHRRALLTHRRALRTHRRALLIPPRVPLTGDYRSIATSTQCQDFVMPFISLPIQMLYSATMQLRNSNFWRAHVFVGVWHNNRLWQQNLTEHMSCLQPNIACLQSNRECDMRK